MFLRTDHGLEQAGGTAALSFGRPIAPQTRPTLLERIEERYPDFELVPDLGSRIGSRVWLRGAASCVALCGLTYLLSPGLDRPIYAAPTPAMHGPDLEATQALSIAPLALGATTGAPMAATDRVVPLKDPPERPVVELASTFRSGDNFRRLLERSGVGDAEAKAVADVLAGSGGVSSLASGTRIDMTLGRRPSKDVPRPLEKVAFRARFDLAMEVLRQGAGFVANPIPIAIDHTPLRIRGRVGSSLYRSARASGAPARAVEAYIKAVASRTPISRIGADAEFDMIVEQQRAETGEVKLGSLLYAGLDQGKSDLQLVGWNVGGRQEWLDTRGRGERRGMMTMPVNGRITSPYGLRRHPILGYARMHKGLDIAAPSGTPIRAATDGVVAFAGRSGGYGNFVKIKHASGYASGYGHMKSIAVRSGTRVSQGQVIGYVGSTGISTGPHLHYEVYRNGAAVNPRNVSYSSVMQLGGSDLRNFRASLMRLLTTPVADTHSAQSAGPVPRTAY